MTQCSLSPMLDTSGGKKREEVGRACYNLSGITLKAPCSRKDKCNDYFIIFTKKCQFFRLLWHSWKMQEADMTNAEQFPATDTFREFMPPSPQDERAQLSSVLGENLQPHQQLLLPYSIKCLFWYTDCNCSRTTVSLEIHVQWAVLLAHFPSLHALLSFSRFYNLEDLDTSL